MDIITDNIKKVKVRSKLPSLKKKKKEIYIETKQSLGNLDIVNEEEFKENNEKKELMKGKKGKKFVSKRSLLRLATKKLETVKFNL